MKGLLRKDICLMLGKTKTIIVLLAVGLMMCFSTDGEFMITYMTQLACIMSISTISYDEYDNGYPFLFTLPITRKEYVRSKYVFSFAMGAAGMLLAIILLFITGKVTGKDTMVNLAGSLIISVGVLLFVLSFMLPIQLRFGAEKSRIVILLFAAVCIAFGTLGNTLLNNVISIDINQIFLFIGRNVWLLGLFGLILVRLSYFISIRVMNKKEF